MLILRSVRLRDQILALFPGHFISQRWRKISHCEIKSGQRPGNKANQIPWRHKKPKTLKLSFLVPLCGLAIVSCPDPPETRKRVWCSERHFLIRGAWSLSDFKARIRLQNANDVVNQRKSTSHRYGTCIVTVQCSYM